MSSTPDDTPVEAATVEPSVPSSKRKHEPIEDEELDGDMDAEDEGVDAKVKRTEGGRDIGPKLLGMIMKLGDSLNGGSIEAALENLSAVLMENMDPYEGQIIDILSECVSYLPEKITVFSTLLGILNARSPEFGQNMVNRLVNDLNHSFSEGDYDVAVRIITFLADLGNAKVLTIRSIFELFENMFASTTVTNVKSDYLVWCILHTMPWIGPELHDRMPSDLQNFFTLVQNYLNLRKKTHLKMLKVWSSTDLIAQDDYLDSLWTQLGKLRKDSWIERHILRPYVSFKSTLETSTEHTLSGIDFKLIEQNAKHPLPRVVFRLFDLSDCPQEEQPLPAVNAIERFLVEEDLNWIIDNNYTDWKLCAKTLLNYHRRDTVPLNYVLVEVIFSQLFRLPNSPHLELFYGTLLIELCRCQPNSMPQVLALAAELLYQRVDTMQPICIDRLVNWFSYHLSNFEYRWSWVEWTDCLEMDSLRFRRILVREVIEKCMRLSFHSKLSEFLPPEFESILPEEPTICYVLDDESHPAYGQAMEFQELIASKAGDDQILLALRKPKPSQHNGRVEGTDAIENNDVKIPIRIHDNDDEEMAVESTNNGNGNEVNEVVSRQEESVVEYLPESVAVFTSVLLKNAAKTISHSFAALSRYRLTFATITWKNEEIQSTILRTLYDSWSPHKQLMTLLVNKMLKMGIIDPAIVQAWVFCDDMKREFKRSWVWDVLDAALIHMSRQQKERQQDNDDGIPAEELISAERNIYLNICHKFTLILAEHLLNCESEGTEAETDFFWYVIGRFRFIFLQHFDAMRRYADDLDRELFSSPTIDHRIRAIFEEFKALIN